MELVTQSSPMKTEAETFFETLVPV